MDIAAASHSTKRRDSAHANQRALAEPIQGSVNQLVASPAEGLARLQQSAGNQAVRRMLLDGHARANDPEGMPSVVRQALDGPSHPLQQDLPNASAGMPRSNPAFTRVHTDRRAQASARAMGARAYTVGNHIVFGTGEYQPSTRAGQDLIGHELVHVSQSLQATPCIYLAADPRLRDYLLQLKQLAADPTLPTKSEDIVARIFESLKGLDLRDQENLTFVAERVAELFPEHVGLGFLFEVQSRYPTVKPTAPSPARLEYERTLRLMEVPRRGAYGTRGPGVLLPLLPAAIPYREVPLALQNAAAGAYAFIAGLWGGLNESVTAEDLQKLADRLNKAVALTIIFPPIFFAGAIAGVKNDIVGVFEAIKGLFTGELGDLLATVEEVVGILVSKDAGPFGLRAGLEFGRAFGQELVEASQMGLIEFTYKLGRLVGPMIIYTILSLLGIPELIVAAIGVRLAEVLGPLLANEPRLARLLEWLVGRMTRPGRPGLKVGPAAGRAAGEKAVLSEAEKAAAAAAPKPGTVGPTKVPPIGELKPTLPADVQPPVPMDVQPPVPKDVQPPVPKEVGPPATKEVQPPVKKEVQPPAPEGAEEIKLSQKEYEETLRRHPFLVHYLDPIMRKLDEIAELTAKMLVEGKPVVPGVDPAKYSARFLELMKSGNTTLAGTYFHNAAAEIGAQLAKDMPAGYELLVEEPIQAGKGGSRLDVFIKGPDDLWIEVDWKTTGKSAFKSAARKEMGKHSAQVLANFGQVLAQQESRSWMDFVRPLLAGKAAP